MAISIENFNCSCFRPIRYSVYDQTCGFKLFSMYVRLKTSQLIVYIIALKTTQFYLIVSQATNYLSMKISIKTDYLD